ncbi:unnamed protein product [Enterobius vermicularis]|uniref:Uncharacterized protein n=1 Tax=Enterobius vermicularis TaxID=51028 RepID=A0A0N4UWQ9_ENTVE|nr:unnamed protein product [Enterobius vermicularis]
MYRGNRATLSPRLLDTALQGFFLPNGIKRPGSESTKEPNQTFQVKTAEVMTFVCYEMSDRKWVELQYRLDTL